MSRTVFGLLFKRNGSRNVLFAACRELTRTKQFQAFWKQYLNYLATKGDVLDPERTGRQAMERVFAQFAPVVRERWAKALPEVFE